MVFSLAQTLTLVDPSSPLATLHGYWITEHEVRNNTQG